MLMLFVHNLSGGRCLSEMVTVAAMLSAEHVFASGVAGGGAEGADGARQRGAGPGAAAANEDARAHMKALVEECKGDHMLQLRLYQLWQDAGATRDFCKAYGLDFRGMNFARDIRRQLEGE
jgi:ATP-dependent RNA helicase DHX8/PRP22